MLGMFLRSIVVLSLVTGSTTIDTTSWEATISPHTDSIFSIKHMDNLENLMEINKKIRNELATLYVDTDTSEAIREKLGEEVFTKIFQPRVIDMSKLLFNNEAHLFRLTDKPGDRMVKLMCKISRNVQKFEKRLRKFANSDEMAVLLTGNVKNVADILKEIKDGCEEYQNALNFMNW